MNASSFDQVGQTTEQRDQRNRPRRSVGRGRSLPSSRAAIGALLVVLSGLGFTLAARRATAEPTTRFVVATRQIAPGEILRSGDLRLETMRLSTPVAGRAFSDTSVLVGAVTVGPVGRGELVQSSLVQAGGPSLREMSFPIESARALNGNINAGDRIDIVATTGSASATSTAIERTSTVLSGLQVVSVRGNSLEPGETSTIVITVAIAEQTQQVALADAVNTAELFVVRANDANDRVETTPLETTSLETTSLDTTPLEAKK